MSELPRAIKEGTLRIAGVDLIVVVLEDGRRIIESKSLERFFEALGNGAHIEEGEMQRVARFAKGVGEPE
ncbi:MAG: hypothetical protein U9Q07_03940 [Planctomycetota bacterium]|nr:hypothetical protein [Planctomycetota bacterium]